MPSDPRAENRMSPPTPARPRPADAPSYAMSVASNQQHRTPRLSSQQLLGAANEIEIEHEGAIYRLRRTSLGKLILTK